MLRASSSWTRAVLRKAGRPRVQRMGWGAKFASTAAQSLKDASERLRADEAFVLKAVKQDWRALKYASDSLKDNEDCQAAQDKVRQIRSEGRVVTLRHVRRCFNKEADSLSNVAMDRPEEEADLRLLLSESGGTAASTQSTTDGNAVLRPSMAPS